MAVLIIDRDNGVYTICDDESEVVLSRRDATIIAEHILNDNVDDEIDIIKLFIRE